MSDAILEQIRDAIQRDVNIRGLARDPHENLFTHCREDFANACRSIAEAPQPCWIGIVTGFFIPHAQPPCGETDGPLGAIFLARAWQALGIKVALFTDDFCRRALEIGLQACDLESTICLYRLCAVSGRRTRRVVCWTEYSPHPAANAAGSPQPAANPPESVLFLALERVGPGRDGRCRNMHGRDVTEEMAPAHQIFQDALLHGPPSVTIGIGDGGNEIGMGKIPPEVIARNIPNGERIACRVPTDHLIVAGISNWGAYALAAGVAVLRRQRLPASLFDVERERELLRIMVEQGPLVDGVSGRQTVTVDGLSFDDYAEPLRRIGELLEKEQCLTYAE